MELCSDDHDEVCYESRTCPVCEVASKLKEAEGSISDLEEQVKDLEKQNDNLENELTAIKEKGG